MKKNGFTLIELLSVIVILTVIALISTPIIIKIVTDSKKNAFQNGAYGIIQATDYLFLNRLENGNFEEIKITYENGIEKSTPAGYQLEYKGKKPKSGNIILTEDGKIGFALFNGETCVVKEFLKIEIYIDEQLDEETCVLESSGYYVDQTGAARPELYNGLIPVVFQNNAWVKANISKKWYNYELKQWANAVVVTSEKKDFYVEAASGTVVEENDVMGYFVWIPRYQYQIFNPNILSIPHQEIGIRFENLQETNYEKKKEEFQNGWYTHPAFTFGSGSNAEKNGIWVGKFETSTATTSACYLYDTTTTCNNAEQQPRVIPQVKSLRYQSVANQFLTAKKFNDSSIYGISNNIDAHMMKNTEWGAVSYLSASKYGKMARVWSNNHSGYQTGCSGGMETSLPVAVCEYTYNSAIGVEASTTGNVYGVYDMSGGSWEYVMGRDESTIGLSGIIESIGPAYYDSYQTGTTTLNQAAYNRSIRGDAMGETRSWYGGHITMVSQNIPWIIRGGAMDSTTYTGPFSFSTRAGAPLSSVSFRIVLVE